MCDVMCDETQSCSYLDESRSMFGIAKAVSKCHVALLIQSPTLSLMTEIAHCAVNQ